VQVVGPHVVPAAYLSHAPAPSQLPFVPQLEAPMSAHWPNGSCPTGTGEQVPSLPGTAHDWQVPAQAPPQQIPCSQKPDWQSDVAVQVPPIGFFPQLPLRHRFPPEHIVFAVQALKQTPPVLHWYGVHCCAAGMTHVPVPLHVDLFVKVVPVHVLCAQTVPAAYLRQAPAPLQTPSFPQLVAPSSAHWFSGS
jgi:hypothetical protein